MAVRRRRSYPIGGQGVPLWQVDLMAIAFLCASGIMLYLLLVLRPPENISPEILTTEIPPLYEPAAAPAQPGRGTVKFFLAGKGGNGPVWTLLPDDCDPAFNTLLDAGALEFDGRTGCLAVHFGKGPISYDRTATDATRQWHARFTVAFHDTFRGQKPENGGSTDADARSRRGHKMRSAARTFDLMLRPHGVIEMPDLRITSAGRLPDAVAGEPYEVQLSASGGVPDRRGEYRWHLVEGELPAGMDRVGLRIGLLKGNLEPGPYRFRLAARGMQHREAQQVFQLEVRKLTDIEPLRVNLPPRLPDCVRLVKGDERTPGGYRLPLTISGGKPPYRVTKPPGGPDWVAVESDRDQKTWVFDVRPGPEVETGVYTVAFAVDDSSPYTDAVETPAVPVRLRAGRPVERPQVLTAAELPEAMPGRPYRLRLAATEMEEGEGWGLLGGRFPPGLEMYPNGEIRGEPTEPGEYTLQVFARNVAGASKPADLRLRVSNTSEIKKLHILTEEVPCAVHGVPYNASLAASGGVPPYRWRVVQGGAPQGLALTRTGYLQGTFDAPWEGETEVVTEAAVEVASEDGQTDTRNLRLRARWLFPGPELRLVLDKLPPAVGGAYYESTLGVQGGVPPVRVEVEGFPDGLACDSEDGGILRGTVEPVQQTARHEVRVLAADRVGQRVEKTMPLAVLTAQEIPPPPLALKTESLPDAHVGENYEVALASEGGYPPYVYELGGELPDGLTFDAARGAIGGVPKHNGPSEFRVAVFDVSGAQTSANLALKVSRSGYPLPSWIVALGGPGLGFSVLLVLMLVFKFFENMFGEPSPEPFASRAKKMGSNWLAILVVGCPIAALIAHWLSGMWGESQIFRMVLNAAAVIALVAIPLFVFEIIGLFRGCIAIRPKSSSGRSAPLTDSAVNEILRRINEGTGRL